LALYLKSAGVGMMYVISFCLGGFFGMFLMPIVTLSYEFSAEVGFPIEENATAGFLLTFSQILSIILVIC
jgi:hypothetical protein